ncbi:uncharacterized protein LOC114351251 [Ostrinia furnacalis]|uniref:uncharacterized protein LOC114351251 n=1 Tax=Ostrinia furnacalis TaxID=93504 RepID=UPI00103BEF64|nr:uncharacterized protein LOC114351251 [Ostrinia furnacalis]
MELRSKKVLSIGPLPGGNRRGAPGAGAGCSSMRSAGDEELSRRAPVDKIATAETTLLRDSPSPQSSLFPSPNSSPKSYEMASSKSPLSYNSSSEFSMDVAQETNSVSISVPTIFNIRKPRMRWTDEYNEAIIRSYYRITKLESARTTYRKPLHQEFITQFPNLSHVSEQRVADQRRLIICNKLLSDSRLQEIRTDIAEELQINNTQINTKTQDSTLTSAHSNTQGTNTTNTRMRWSDELNESLMRCYYIVTESETNMSAYRNKLHKKFIDTHPNLAHITAQRLSDQRRSIVNNRLVHPNKLLEIKNEVTTEANTNENFIQSPSIDCTIPNYSTQENTFTSHTIDTNSITYAEQNSTQQTNTTTLEEETHQSRTARTDDSDSDANREIRDTFEETYLAFIDSEPTSRPYIRKQKTSKKLSAIIHYINTTILPNYLNKETDFITLQTIIYCAAWTAAKCNGTKMETTTEGTNRTTVRRPKWEIRLEKKKEDLRAKIAKMTQFNNGNRSPALIDQVKKIMDQYKIHSVHEEPNTQITQFIDTLKQKLTVITSRIKRYRACTLRKTQNTQFHYNEKNFYRNLKTSTTNNASNNEQTSNFNIPAPDTLRNFWSEIWEEPKDHNDKAEWIEAEYERNEHIQPMPFEFIPIDTFQDVIRRLHNWKAPGSDKIHNFWYKKLTFIHPFLHNHLNEYIKNPETIPDYIMTGTTYMIPKDSTDTTNPAKYRPITCLQTIYKILNSCLTNVMYEHIENNQILAEQQKGCRKFSQGCKEQLIIDSVILRQVQRQKRELHSMYIDYRKAYDSVPHTWLLEVLRIYKIHPTLTNFLRTVMQKWTTRLKVAHTETDPIYIKRGIFQGDSLSPLWFCLALNPLSNLLISSNTGFELKHIDTHTSRPTTMQINHLMYMDDIKLYAQSQDSLYQLANLTEQFSNDICMEFGIDKCKINAIKAGQNQRHTYQMESGQRIDSLEENEVYKYLGYNQAKLIEYKDTKAKLLQQFKHRLNSVMKTQLHSRNITKAINSFAVPILTYSFGIIKWTKTELNSIQRIINTTLTKHRKHHPRACIQRQTLPRNEGGRGIIDIQNLHNKQITTLRSYFHQKAITSTLHQATVQADIKLTPLNLQDMSTQENELQTSTQTKISEWTRKSLHGRHRHDLCQPNVDKIASNAWLSRGELFPETEGFMIAIQDQIIETRNYQKHIMRIPNLPTDLCRKCNSSSETIQHVTGACKAIVQTDYKHRHDQVANIIHQKLACKYKLITHKPTPYYKYEPEPVLENSQYRLYFDRAILTDRTTHYNRPDITLQDKNNRTATIIDIAIPNTHNLQNSISEKLSKYTDLKDEIRRMWRLNEVNIVPIVLSTTGVIPKQLHQSLNTLNLPPLTYISLQKAVILNTCRIVRKFLQTHDSHNQPTRADTDSTTTN